MKKCTQCKVEKELTDFHRLAKSSDGRQPVCRVCVSQYQKARYAADPERFKLAEETKRRAKGVQPKRVGRDLEKMRRWQRNHHYTTLYGITLEDYEQMLEEQEGVCAICSDPPNGTRPLSVDHNHETGAVRALLCGHCNAALGHAREDPARLHNMVAYLDRW